MPSVLLALCAAVVHICLCARTSATDGRIMRSPPFYYYFLYFFYFYFRTDRSVRPAAVFSVSSSFFRRLPFIIASILRTPPGGIKTWRLPTELVLMVCVRRRCRLFGFPLYGFAWSARNNVLRENRDLCN